MFETKIRKHNASIINFKRWFYLGENITRKQKIIILRRLVKFCENEIDLSSFYVNVDDTLDYVILKLCIYIQNKQNHFEFHVTDNDILISQRVYAEYDAASIPLLAFYNERKNKKFFAFLCNILNILASMGVDIMDNDDYYDRLLEYYEEESLMNDEFNSHYLIQKHYKKIIIPFVKHIREHSNNTYSQNKLYYWAKKKPAWRKFLLDFNKVYKSKFKFYHIKQANIGKDANEEGYIDFEQMFRFRWDFEHQEYVDKCYERFTTIDTYANWDMTQTGYSGYWGLPYVVFNVLKPITLEEFEKNSINAENLLKLFYNKYECFRN